MRDCYTTELREMYQALRSNNVTPFSYDAFSNKINSHQSAWPEMCWNYDAQFKYLDAFDRGQNYLDMLQGNKQAQREWWLYNAFKYRDSKYRAGEAAEKYIILRVYKPGEITITPYSHIYARVQFGNAKDTITRAYRNEPVAFNTEGITDLNDLETHIFSPDRIVDLGDLSNFEVGLCDISQANKLQRLILGRREESYENTNLKSLTVGNNELLREINVANCTALGTASTKILNLAGCPCLETLDASNTKLTSVEFSNGGRLETVYLPDTITALTIRNQPNIKTLDIAGYENITTIALENIPNVDIEALVANCTSLNRVRLVGAHWNATSEEALMATIDKLSRCDGLSADGSTTLVKAVTGRVYIDAISDASLETINDLFPELVVVVDGTAKFFVRYNDWNNTLLYRYIADEGTKIIDPVAQGYISAPVREDTANTKSTWRGWSDLPEAISKPMNIVAKYNNQYRVLFLNTNDEPYEMATQWVNDGESAVEPVSGSLILTPTKESSAQYEYNWIGWDRDYTIITAPMDFKPLFNATLRSYKVYFMNDSTILQESNVLYGGTATFTGDTTAIKKLVGGEPSDYYEFTGWSPNPDNPITGSTYYYAQYLFDGYIEDDWATIIQAAAEGNLDKYGLGGRKKLTYNITGSSESEVELELVGKNHDILATTNENYNNGASTAAFTFVCRIIGNESRVINGTPHGGEDLPGLNAYGWSQAELRTWLQETLIAALPQELQQGIKPVIKISDRGYYLHDLTETTDTIWLPSEVELGNNTTSVLAGQGTPYQIYTDAASRKKSNYGGGLTIYWTRSTGTNGQHFYRYIDSQGYPGNLGAGNNAGVAWGFCV